jgi:hypothetical protein
MGPEAYRVFGALFKKKNTKLGMRMNIHLGPLPGP